MKVISIYYPEARIIKEERILSTIRHALPGKPGDDSKWFEELSPFEKEAVKNQVDFKSKYLTDLVDGRFSKNTDHIYPYILPAGCEFFVFYQPIAKQILNYLSDEDIELHSEARNLKSSQVACLNFLFPLHNDLNLATQVLKSVLPDLKSITSIDFEYTGPPEITEWLGEPKNGKRGKYRTSIDAAIFWLDYGGKRHATLAEWKYCEENFGKCSAYDSGKHNAEFKCDEINLLSDADPSKKCLLTRIDQKPPRRYWEHLIESGIATKAFLPVSGCPFKGPFYQLMRQCEVAAFLRKSGSVDFAEVMVISFKGNDAILEISRELTPLISSPKSDMFSIWNSGLNDVSPVRHVLIEQIMEYGDKINYFDTEWRTYIHDRYGI